MAKSNVQHDVIVIGAGIAGLVAANRAAQLGKRVIVLE
jgi:flavin-dependent dehydrogenase